MSIKTQNLLKVLKLGVDCGIELPDGWFGQPYDNFPTIETISAFDDFLEIIFEKGSISLSFHGEWILEASRNEIRLSEFSECRFEWRDYMSKEGSQVIYTEGIVKLHSRVGDHFI